MEYFLEFILLLPVIALIVWIAWWTSVNKAVKRQLDEYARQHNTEIDTAKRERQQALDLARQASKDRAYINRIVAEKSQTCPWLASFVAEYYQRFDKKLEEDLLNRSHPAPRAAENVARLSAEKRVLREQLKLTEHQLIVYESAYPWLLEFKELTFEEIEQAAQQAAQFSSGENKAEKDALHKWLSDVEYDQFSKTERYQLALDRYKTYPRSAWEAGIAYERFIGYQYEIAGCKVDYNGATTGLNDMGRDIIAYRRNTVYIIQCKRYHAEKEVHENTVFQLYGSCVLYRLKHPDANIKPVIYSSGKLSSVARDCANHLGVLVRDSVPLEDYPMIKCNISSSGEKIYHLPFDQQYDRVRIEISRGEQYVHTVQEAEALGFRRAWRWHGT